MNIKDLTPEELRQFIQHHHVKEYALIDVRQPGEYEQGHIPGALLLPLPKLVQGMEALPTEKRLVFYCHTGSRSMAAAMMVADEEIGSGDLINLAGGILAWDGGMTADYPKVQVFNWQAAPSDMLITAMNLEKGALNFYSHVGDKFREFHFLVCCPLFIERIMKPRPLCRGQIKLAMPVIVSWSVGVSEYWSAGKRKKA